MRPIGTLPDEAQAGRFGDLLYAKGIEGQVDRNLHGLWEVWVLDDDNIEPSRALLEEFRRNPENPNLLEASQAVARQRQQAQADQTPKRTRILDARSLLLAPTVSLGPLSIALIGISITVAILTSLGTSDRFVQPMSITEYQSRGQTISWDGGLPEIRRGQLWRLFTPIFLHFGFAHILFNMLILRDLASMIETHKGSPALLILVLVIAGASNLAQYLVSGPAFGGMSGVNYGLLGYIWMQGRFNPTSRLSLHPQTVTWAIVWFFLCLAGIIPHIANTVHGVGLVLGVAWGFIDARMRVALRRY